MNIKKILKAGLAGMVLASSFASAHVMDDMNVYVGGDASVGRWSYGSNVNDAAAAAGVSAKKSNHSFGLVLGSKFHENFGAEVGYTWFGKTKAVDVAGVNAREVKAHNMHIDAIGYAPVADNVNLLGSLGLGRMRTRITDNGANSAFAVRNSKTGIRVGAGVGYTFDECWTGRLMARYQRTGSSSDATRNLKSIGVGLTYSFM